MVNRLQQILYLEVCKICCNQLILRLLLTSEQLSKNTFISAEYVLYITDCTVRVLFIHCERFIVNTSL